MLAINTLPVKLLASFLRHYEVLRIQIVRFLNLDKSVCCLEICIYTSCLSTQVLWLYKDKLLNFLLEKEYAHFFAQVYDKPFRMLAMIMIIQFFSFRLRLIGFFSHSDYSGNSSLLAAWNSLLILSLNSNLAKIRFWA